MAETTNPYAVQGQAPFSLLANIVRGVKGKQEKDRQAAELNRILTNPEGGELTREGMLGRMGQSKNQQIQQLLMAEMLKKPQEAKNPFGSGARANALWTAYSRPDTPEGRLAYQELQTPQRRVDPVTQQVIEIQTDVPQMIQDLYAVPKPTDGGVAPDGGVTKVAEGVTITEGVGKPAPVSIVNAYQSNVQQERKLTQIIDAMKDPEKLKTLGWQNKIPGSNFAYQLLSPESTDVRGLIAGLQSMTYKDISGANVTATEEVRLQPYVPNINDQPEVAKEKARLFLQEYQAILNDQEEIFRSQGYKLPELREQKGQELPLINTQKEYDALPSGAKYKESDGKTYTKP